MVYSFAFSVNHFWDWSNLHIPVHHIVYFLYQLDGLRLNGLKCSTFFAMLIYKVYLSDGAFESIQCDEKYCWCVLKDGTEIDGTRITNDRSPNCECMIPFSHNFQRDTLIVTNWWHYIRRRHKIWEILNKSYRRDSPNLQHFVRLDNQND